MRMRKVLAASGVAVLLVAVGTWTRSLAADTKPAVHITEPVPWGIGGESPMAQIAGTVEAAPVGSVVHIFCFAGGQWWVQPWVNDNALRIKNSRWETSTHLGERYAALLTSGSWKAPATIEVLPPVGGDIFAAETVAGKK